MRNECPYPPATPKTVCSFDGLLYFIWEREAIKSARDNGWEAPWTSDEIFAKYKFTNIHRRDDRVSKWIIDHIVIPAEGRRDLWFILLITRLINWPPTLYHLINDNILFKDVSDFDPVKFSNSVEEFKANNSKVYSGAYMTYPTRLEPGTVKSLSIAQHILGSAVANAEAITDAVWEGAPCIEKVVNELSNCFGISTFMAGQVAADMTYTYEQLGGAIDLYTYAPIGPGSSRGLNYLHHRKPFAAWSQTEFNSALTQINEEIIDQLDIDDLTLHDVQNCMCEYSKYCRAMLGEGKPKIIYQPQEEF